MGVRASCEVHVDSLVLEDAIEEHLTSVGLLALQVGRLQIRAIMVNWVQRVSSDYLQSIPDARLLAVGVETEFEQMKHAATRLQILELWGQKQIEEDVRRLSMAALIACSSASKDVSREMGLQIADLRAQVRWQLA